jgi:hypothetical protein
MQEIRLNNPRAVSRLLNRTINQLMADEISEGKARTLGYLCSVLLKAAEVEDLDQRMTELESEIQKAARA